MEHLEEHYHKLNRVLLSLSGLSPYQSRWSAYLIRIVVTILMLSSIFVQISYMCTSDVTMEFIVDAFPNILLIIGNLSSLYTRVSHVDKFRELFERMSKDWALQKTQDEIKIMHDYAETSRLSTLYSLIVMYINVVGYNVWMFIPEILDIVSPMNESRPRRQPFSVEFFIDKERYFYLIRSHECLVMFTMPIIYITCSTLFLTLTQHVCGMCKLLGYRVERLFCVVKDKMTCDIIQESRVNYRNNITVFVQQHYNIIQFVDIIETCHTLPFLLELIGIIVLISLSLIQVLTISDFERAIRSLCVFVGSLSYIFLSFYMGQRITDMNSMICDKIFNSMWYNIAISEQKALLIIIMRRYHPLVLTACRFYVMSLQNYGMILQTAISYCMFIRQF